jgi:hypothetical protein
MFINIIQPCIVADPGQPGALTVSDGAWSGSVNGAVTCRYQWRMNGFDIPGETGNTYTPDASDAGYTASCYVAAADAAGNVGAHISNGVLVA